LTWRPILVDNAVVRRGSQTILFVLPEGAAELATESQVLASVETESERKFLRAFCCLRPDPGRIR